VLERTNVRELDAEAAGGRVPVLVADLSFISLRSVAPALARLTTAEADLVFLVKPQFEAGRARVGKGGIVRDPSVHLAVLREVVEALARDGIVVIDAVPSPIRGADGNVEFLAHATKHGEQVDEARLAALVEGGNEDRP
jgi:23S rRNA (cytidine1920-2'-O)/16S rRNA (cytidine1409-2'-O)-methyltransferase